MDLATMTDAQINQLPKELRDSVRAMIKQNTLLAKAVSGTGNFSVKLGLKGTIVVSGFGRYPHTYYVEQYKAYKAWLQDGGFDTIDAFIEANGDKLSTKVQQLEAAAVNGNGNGAAKDVPKG